MAGPALLPKKGTAAFRAESSRILHAMDIMRAMLVLEGALDRRALEDIIKRSLKRPMRAGAVARHELVAAVSQTWRTDERVAFTTMRALDKAAHKERHIVASIATERLDGDIENYKALDFRRERARMIWALLRDGRDECTAHAERILKVVVDSATDGAETRRVSKAEGGGVDQAALKRVQERLSGYEEALKEQNKALTEAMGERERVERERSELMARLGQKERALRVEEEARREHEREVKQLRAELKSLRSSMDDSPQEVIGDLKAERDRLKKRANTLEEKLARTEKVAELQQEKAKLDAELRNAHQQLQAQRADNEQLLRQIAAREKAAHDRVSDLRTSLKQARRLAASPSQKDPSFVDGEPIEERIGVFIDAANLSASARRERGKGFDFVAALDEWCTGSRRTVARIYVVDNVGDDAQAGFKAFTKALRDGGFEVRQKRAKKRPDGTVKADWDMGMAMEILDERNRLDTILLATGDGDFVPLVRRLKQWGKQVVCASFRASTDSALIRAVDEYLPLEGRFTLRS